MSEPADVPNVPNIPFRDAYGDYNLETADGKYYFEWTPFTPAIRAWERAQRNLRNARDRLLDARKIKGFAIPGMEQDCEDFKAQLTALIEKVDTSRREADTVVEALNTANTDYATAHDASYDAYQRLRDVIDQTLEAQGRRRL
jgi:hypothetical protein